MKLITTYPIGLQSSIDSEDGTFIAILLIDEEESFFEEYVAQLHHQAKETRVSLEWRRTSRRDRTGWTWTSDSRTIGSMDRIHPIALEEMARIARLEQSRKTT